MTFAAPTRQTTIVLISLQTWTTTATLEGRLSDGHGRALRDGIYGLTINLYDTPFAETPLYAEEVMFRLIGGRFSVLFGSASPLDLRIDQPLFMGLQTGGGNEVPYRLELKPNATQARIWSPLSAHASRPLAA